MFLLRELNNLVAFSEPGEYTGATGQSLTLAESLLPWSTKGLRSCRLYIGWISGREMETSGDPKEGLGILSYAIGWVYGNSKLWHPSVLYPRLVTLISMMIWDNWFICKGDISITFSASIGVYTIPPLKTLRQDI